MQVYTSKVLHLVIIKEYILKENNKLSLIKKKLFPVSRNRLVQKSRY